MKTGLRQIPRHRTAADVNKIPATRHNLLVEVARLYYLNRLTHQQIADRMGVSRVKVTRLLKEAVDADVVEFRIADPALETFELQDTLRARFALDSAIIVPSSKDADQQTATLGRYAAGYVMQSVKNHMTIGFGWGRTLSAMVPYLGKTGKRGVQVVSLTGGLSANENQPNPYDVATGAATALGAEAHYILAPLVLKSAEVKNLLLAESNVASVTTRWHSLDMCVLTVGALAPHTGIFFSSPDPLTEVERARRLGAVGDLLARPVSIAGDFVDNGLTDKMIAIELDTLRRVPRNIAVAGGKAKVEAILGTLRTGILKALIIDEMTARAVLRAAGNTVNSEMH